MMRERTDVTPALPYGRTVFEPEEAVLINRAFLRALSQFCAARKDDELWRATRNNLAKAVIEAAKWGVIDPETLSQQAIWQCAGAGSKTRPRH